MEEITGPLIQYGLALVFANVLITRLGVPLPAIPTLIVAGALTRQGYSSVPLMIAIASVASVIGDLPWYYAGRRFGSRAIDTLCRIAVEPDFCVRQAEGMFQRWGAPSLMVGRLVPGVARMAPPIAGALKLGLPQYLAYSAVGAALWSGLAVGMGAIFHVQVNRALEWVEKMGGWAALAIGIVAGLYVAFKLLQRTFFIRRIVRKMSIQLPPAIDLYVKAENAGDAEGVAQFFAPDAVVHDEGRVHKGLAAIKSWKVETRKKYNHRLEPLEIATRDGKTVLRARVSGNFPGSPIVLSFTFVLEGGRIVSLKIG